MNENDLPVLAETVREVGFAFVDLLNAVAEAHHNGDTAMVMHKLGELEQVRDEMLDSQASMMVAVQKLMEQRDQAIRQKNQAWEEGHQQGFADGGDYFCGSGYLSEAVFEMLAANADGDWQNLADALTEGDFDQSAIEELEMFLSELKLRKHLGD